MEQAPISSIGAYLIRFGKTRTRFQCLCEYMIGNKGASSGTHNHMLQRTGGTVGVPTLLGQTPVGGGFTARR
jgi:hypothetical protein